VTINLVGIDEIEIPDADIKVYPNPFHDVAMVEIEGGDFMEIDFELYDMTGKVIYQKQLTILPSKLISQI